MKLEIGQIIYIVKKGSMSIEPAMVVEEIVKRTLSHGLEENYLIEWDDGGSVLLGNVEGEVFNNVDELRNVLVSRATTSIERMIAQTSKRAKSSFSERMKRQDGPDETLVDNTDTEIPVESPAPGDIVVLPDGTRAKVKSIKVAETSLIKE